MELHHEFTVPVPVDEAWHTLLDIERVAPCMPGATVEAYDGKTVTGSVKVKVGPITMTYKGTAVFEEQDGAAHRMVLVATGRETRGQGTARATVTGALTGHDGGTTVSVRTELTVTGRPAQFGRGVIAEVGDRLVGQFAACLSQRLTAPAEPAEQETQEAPPGAVVAGGAAGVVGAAGAPPDEAGTEPLDLFRAAAVPVAKRAGVVLAAAAALAWVVIRLWRRGRP
ncbi:SRPBCC family protein [Streptomyces sp. NPDC047000]|uniref:SRPBCC family protein n=1 Tax=Streptomyces sp. NPDC047000 TaxID=3155474 RepID=UPI0033F4BC39